MLPVKFQQLLSLRGNAAGGSSGRFLSSPFLWFSLSLVAPLYFGLISLYYVLSQDYIVQDDARQHIVWLQRYVDPELFPNDLIADYFQAVVPAGYKLFYWTMAQLGIDPLMLAKVLPVLLGLVATLYLFGISLQILPVPAGAFVVTLIGNQLFWLNDNLVSSTPRAFVYPLFAAFLYYLLKRALIPCLLAMALQGLFYPQLLLVEVALLTVRLFTWARGRLQLLANKKVWVFWLSGQLVALIVLLPLLFGTANLGTTVTAAQMQAMPEFGLLGRSEYFGIDPLSFILGGSSGLRIPLFPSIVWLSAGLPLLLKSRLRLVRLISRDVMLLWQVVIASLGMFLLAHLLLPKLHLPSRYTAYSLRFVMAIATGLILIVLLDAGCCWLRQKRHQAQLGFKERLVISAIALLTTVAIVFPAVPPVFLVWYQNWVVGQAPGIYQFLASQPKATLIASLAEEANNIPAFAQRSILLGREFALAYHPQYYEQIQQRAIDLLLAQYSQDPAVMKRVIDKYGIDFFMIERSAFSPSYLAQPWLIHSSFKAAVLAAISQLEEGQMPTMAQLVEKCSAFSDANLVLLDAACLTKEIKVF